LGPLGKGGIYLKLIILFLGINNNQLELLLFIKEVKFLFMKKLIAVFLFLIIFPFFTRSYKGNRNTVNNLGKQVKDQAINQLRNQQKKLANVPVFEIIQLARRNTWRVAKEEDPLLLNSAPIFREFGLT